MQFLSLILAAVAYWSLLTFDPRPQGDLTEAVEQWLFVPTDTSPLVVVLLSAWLLYRRRAELEAIVGRHCAPGLAAVFFASGLAIHAWAAAVDAPDLLAFSLIAVGLGGAAVLAGRPGLRAVAVPAVFLVFAVPYPGPLMNAVLFNFQIWTADYTGWLLDLAGMTAYVSNDQIIMADDGFAVIEGCSGLRSVQTLTMVSVLLVDLFRRRGWHAATIVLLAPVVAFALNGMRVITLIVNPDSEIVAIHTLQGVAILLGGLGLLYLVDGALERLSSPELAAAEDPAGEDRGLAAPAQPSGMVRAAVPVVLAACVLLTWVMPQLGPAPPPSASRDRAVEVRRALDSPKRDIGSWEAQPTRTDRSFLGTVAVQPYVEQRYRWSDAAVSADGPVRGDEVTFFALAGDPDDRFHSPLSAKTAFPGSGWQIEQVGVVALTPELEVEWRIVRIGTQRQLVYHWVEGAGSLASEAGRTFLALHRTPWGRRPAILAFRLSTPITRANSAERALGHTRLSNFYRTAALQIEGIRRQSLKNRIS